jgi:hypothetical protein
VRTRGFGIRWAAATSFGALIVAMAALILAFPLSTVLFFLSSSAASVVEAERSKPSIDISEPTENVLWELEELTKRFGDKCVLIGHHERVAALAALPRTGGGARSVERRLADLLDGREVPAYTTDPRGLKRFARALSGLLLTWRA